ncbi:hypothetical protein BH23CHL5_BH23CHL5_24890 [soil metagenome]
MIERIWITVPAGSFLMGSDARDAAPPFENEHPLHLVDLPEFRVGRVPVTNAAYARFIAATGYEGPGHWTRGQPTAGSEAHPVTYVSWHDALAFCEWASVRLLTEAEWEKSARGPALLSSVTRRETRWWPWGDVLPGREYGHIDAQLTGIPPAAQGVLPVGQFPRGASPYGVLDLAGNVWEWTSSRYKPYPFSVSEGRQDSSVSGSRVVRGGSYNHGRRHVRCSARDHMVAGVRDVYIGFRVAAELDVEPRLDIDWVNVPAGPFWMGSEPDSRICSVFPDETPQHEVMLPEYQIGQTPVTNEEYAEFVDATGYIAPPHWFSGLVPDGLEKHPVTHVDWKDATAYSTWAGVRLPTEPEWEKAAAGSDARPRIYPWGNEPPTGFHVDFGRQGQVPGTTPVGRFPGGATPHGILDMAGNVWEWVQSRYGPYPYDGHDGREDDGAPGARVLRGGSFSSPSDAYVRGAMRSLSFETRRREHIGFRVARDV